MSWCKKTVFDHERSVLVGDDTYLIGDLSWELMIDTDYGADADGNRGQRRVFVDDLTLGNVYKNGVRVDKLDEATRESIVRSLLMEVNQ